MLALSVTNVEVVHWSTVRDRGLDLCFRGPLVVDAEGRVHLTRADLEILLRYVDDPDQTLAYQIAPPT
jgi:hypothetical protein